MVHKARRIRLTATEKKVLALACHALPDSEIAEKLCVSTSTVKNAIHHACVKLGAENRMQAVYSAIYMGSMHWLDIYSFEQIVEMTKSLSPEEARSIYLAALGANNAPFTEETEKDLPKDRELELLVHQLQILPDDKSREKIKSYIRFILQENEQDARVVRYKA